MFSNHPSRKDYQDLARWEQSAWVLVVDDDDDYRAAMVETLEDAGYRTRGVASGDQALEAMHDQPFLVLTDFGMPGMNGSELLTAMQAELGSRIPPMVFLTGASPSMIDNIAAQVLSKPVDRSAPERGRPPLSARACGSDLTINRTRRIRCRTR